MSVQIEIATNQLRWVGDPGRALLNGVPVGTPTLQQMWRIEGTLPDGDSFRHEWRDVPTVSRLEARTGITS